MVSDATVCSCGHVSIALALSRGGRRTGNAALFCALFLNHNFGAPDISRQLPTGNLFRRTPSGMSSPARGGVPTRGRFTLCVLDMRRLGSGTLSGVSSEDGAPSREGLLGLPTLAVDPPIAVATLKSLVGLGTCLSVD